MKLTDNSQKLQMANKHRKKDAQPYLQWEKIQIRVTVWGYILYFRLAKIKNIASMES